MPMPYLCPRDFARFRAILRDHAWRKRRPAEYVDALCDEFHHAWFAGRLNLAHRIMHESHRFGARHGLVD